MNSLGSRAVVSERTVTVSHLYDLGDFEPAVRVGQDVGVGDVIATRKMTAHPSIIDLPNGSGQVSKSETRPERFTPGSPVAEGETLAAASGPFGFGKRSITAPTSGTVEFHSESGSVLVIRPDDRTEDVVARFPGRVSEIHPHGIEVELSGRVIRGVLGTGPEVTGPVAIIRDSEDISAQIRSLTSSETGAPARIICFQTPIDLKTTQLVRDADQGTGPIALIAPSMSFQDFTVFEDAATDISCVIIEGFGTKAFGNAETDPVWGMLTAAEQTEGVAIPQALGGGACVVLTASTAAPEGAAVQPRLEPGTPVRFLRGLGIAHGTVLDVPDEPSILPSGYKTEAVLVAVEDGAVEMVATGNLDILSESTGEG